jgi:hypothetical protein
LERGTDVAILNQRLRATFTILLFLLATAMASPAVIAAKPPSLDRLVEQIAAAPNPAAALAALPTEQQQRVIENLRVAILVTEAPLPSSSNAPAGEFSVAASGCWTVTWGRSGYNAFGYELFSLKQRIDWCGNGSTITSVQRTRWIETYAPGWSGTIIQDPTWGGVGQWSFRAFTQAEMILNLVYPWQHSYPWLDMTVTAAGGLSGSGGGT